MVINVSLCWSALSKTDNKTSSYVTTSFHMYSGYKKCKTPLLNRHVFTKEK